jgi:uncharacterized membrane protein YhaH (DUF805 family)
MNKFNQVTPQVQVPPPPSYAEKSFLHTVPAAVQVPALQSLLISVAIGLLSFIVQARLGAILSDAFLNSVIGTIIMFILIYVFLLRHWFALTIERAFDIDIPGLGEERKPVETVIKVNKITPDRHWQQTRYDFAVAPDLLLRFFIDTLSGRRSISRRSWTTPKMQNGFSQGDWKKFQDQLIKWQWVENSGAGLDYTDDGWDQAFEYVRAHSPADAVEIERILGHQPTNQPTNQAETGEEGEGE